MKESLLLAGLGQGMTENDAGVLGVIAIIACVLTAAVDWSRIKRGKRTPLPFVLPGILLVAGVVCLYHS